MGEKSQKSDLYLAVATHFLGSIVKDVQYSTVKTLETHTERCSSSVKGCVSLWSTVYFRCCPWHCCIHAVRERGRSFVRSNH